MGYPVTKNRMVDGGDTWIIGGDIKRDGAVEGSDAGAVSVVLPVHYSLDPDAVSATYVHAAVTLGADAQDVTTGITNPDFPRTVTVKGNASGIAGNVVITGTNAAGDEITDTIALNGASEVEGVKAFATVTNINLPAKTNVSGDTVSVGEIGRAHV